MTNHLWQNTFWCAWLFTDCVRYQIPLLSFYRRQTINKPCIKLYWCIIWPISIWPQQIVIFL